MITQENFDEWLAKDGERTKVVLFWREECEACERMFSTVAAVAHSHPKVDFLALNGPKNPRVYRNVETPGLPTLVLYEGGEQQTKLVGFTKPDGVNQWLKDRATVQTKELCEFCRSVREMLRPFLPQRFMKWIESYAR